MAPKLTSCGVFGILVKYRLSSEGGFGDGKKTKSSWCAVKWYWAAFPPSTCDWWRHNPLLGGICAM